MAYGPQGIIPSYSYQVAYPAESTASSVLRHGSDIGLGALTGGFNTYLMRRAQQMQQQPQQLLQAPQIPQPTIPGIPKANSAVPAIPGSVQEPQNIAASNNQILDLLRELTGKKVDAMNARYAPQPEVLQEQAYNAANQQTSNSSPPQWAPKNQGGFADILSNIAPLAPTAYGQAMEMPEDEEDQGWLKNYLPQGARKAIHGIGALAGLGAPLASNIPGPWGIGLGVGLGGLSALSRKL